MQFLDIAEYSLLVSILVNHVFIANIAARRDLLINCGLQGLLPSLSSLDKSSLLFVHELLAQLLRRVTTTEPSGFITFLNYISIPPYDVDLSWDEKSFLERVKQAYLRWSPSRRGRPISANGYVLEKPHQVYPPPIQPSGIISREEVIVSYGLYALVSEFIIRVNYGKASAFTVEGDFAVLRGYIIERLFQEFKRRVSSPTKLLDLSLDAQDVAEGKDILLKVMSRNTCNKLIDLFTRDPKTHLMLVIWCHAIAQEQIQAVSVSFWKEVEEHVAPLLQMQNRSFVLIIAKVGREESPYQIDAFTTLHIPLQFDLSDVLPWLCGRLEGLYIERSDIDYCLTRVRDQRGDIVRTYHELEHIVSYLQERYC